MDPIKEAFEKIKQDIFSLRTEIQDLKHQVSDLKFENQQLKHIITSPANKETQISQNPTLPTQNPTQISIPTDNPTQNPTVPHEMRGLETQNMDISTRNRGVPTDNPTNRQTIRQTDNLSTIASKTLSINPKSSSFDEFERATEILNSLDSLKKEIRLKFKRLTPQEMQVFTMLYTLENQAIEEITYKIIAQNLNLSESSIRDYIQKLISKGIPVLKIRQNNKKITLKISPDLQKITNLSTIIKLREL